MENPVVERAIYQIKSFVLGMIVESLFQKFGTSDDIELVVRVLHDTRDPHSVATDLLSSLAPYRRAIGAQVHEVFNANEFMWSAEPTI